MNVRLKVLCVLAAAAATAVGAEFKIHNLPPAHRLLHPGPGVGGPGPGVLAPSLPPSLPMGGGFVTETTVQIHFRSPEGMQIRWDVSGVSQFDSDPRVLPTRQNFPGGGIYRLKLTNIPGREGVELYPSLEVGPVNVRTDAYLAHSAIPIQFTQEDFDQVQSGNQVTKVIYLPDPEFQELALAGVETLVSTRLTPGVDPIVEADRRGSIMAVVRLGDKDIELPGMLGDGMAPVTMGGGMPVSWDGGAPVVSAAEAMGFAPMPPGNVSGVTTYAWGMPISGTPIGLPGPPHIPLGGPAGLQRHVMKNRTQMHLPGPTEKLHIRVRETPGYSYPRPPHHIRIREQHIHPALPFSQPRSNQIEVVH